MKKFILGLVGVLVIGGVIIFGYEEAHKADISKELNDKENTSEVNKNEVKDNNEKSNNKIKVNDNISIVINEQDAKKYNSISEKIQIEKISFDGIDENKISEFNKKQDELVNNIINTLNMYLEMDNEGSIDDNFKSDFRIETIVNHSITNDILNVSVKFVYPTLLGPFNEDMISLNYSLKYEKMLTNKEIVELMGYDPQNVIDQIYDLYGKIQYVNLATDNISGENIADVYETKADVYKTRINEKFDGMIINIKDDKIALEYMIIDAFRTLDCSYGVGTLMQYAEYIFKK